MTVFAPVDHLTVKHEYSSGNWQDFTGDLVSFELNLREMPGKHTATLVFYNSQMDPAEGSGTRVIKRGDRVKVFMDNSSSVRRKTGTFKVHKVSVDIDFKRPVGKQYRVTAVLHGTGITGVAGIGGSSGVASHRELSNVITASNYEIDGNDFTLHKENAWVGTAHASTSTLTDDEDVVRTNMCLNPSFETGTTGWAATGGGITLSNPTQATPQGAKVLQAVGTTTGGDTYVLTNIACTGSTTYTVSAYRYVPSAPTGAATGNRSLRVQDSTGVAATTTTLTTGVTVGQWVRESVTITTASGATTIGIRLYVPNGTVVWDGVLVEQAGSMGSYFDGSNQVNSGISQPSSGVVLRTNLQTNPGFEVAFFDGGGNHGTSTIWSFDTGVFLQGTRSLKLNTTGATGAIGAMFDRAAVVNGQTYTASVWLRRATGTGTIRIQVEWLTAANAFISNGAFTDVSTGLPATTWTQFTVTDTAPSTAAKARVHVFYTTYVAGTDVCNVDQVQVELGSAASGYFDGATADTDQSVFAWTGTANQSASTDTGAFLEVASINAATEWDQVTLTKDSNPEVVGFEDPTGTVQLYDGDKYRTSATKTWTASDYADIDQQYDTSHIINVVIFKYFEKIKTGAKHTRVVEHDITFEDAPSIAKNGRFKKVIKTHKKTDFAAHAAKILAKNADPEQVPRSITFNINKASQLLPGYEDNHWVGHKVIVTLPDGTTNYTCRIRRIRHHIQGRNWTVQVFLRAHFEAQVVRNGLDTFGTEVGNNPDGSVQGSQLDDDVDATGKTVTNGTVQTKDAGNRIVMHDDGSEGTLDFYAGIVGETKGQINPSAVSGSHRIDIVTSSDPSATPGGHLRLSSGTVADVPTARLVNTHFDCDGNANVDGTLGVGGIITGDDAIHSNTNGLFMDDLTGGGSTGANIGNSGRIVRTPPSSERFKENIEPLTLEEAERAYELVSVIFQYRNREDYGDEVFAGFIAEQALQVGLGRWVILDGAGEPVGFRYAELTAALVLLIRSQRDRLDDHEHRLRALEEGT